MTIDRIDTPYTVELSRDKLIYDVELAESSTTLRRAYQELTFTFPSATTQQFTFTIPDEDYSVQTVATSNFTTLMDDFINKVNIEQQAYVVYVERQTINRYRIYAVNYNNDDVPDMNIEINQGNITATFDSKVSANYSNADSNENGSVSLSLYKEECVDGVNDWIDFATNTTRQLDFSNLNTEFVSTLSQTMYKKDINYYFEVQDLVDSFTPVPVFNPTANFQYNRPTVFTALSEKKGNTNDGIQATPIYINYGKLPFQNSDNIAYETTLQYRSDVTPEPLNYRFNQHTSPDFVDTTSTFYSLPRSSRAYNITYINLRDFDKGATIRMELNVIWTDGTNDLVDLYTGLTSTHGDADVGGIATFNVSGNYINDVIAANIDPTKTLSRAEVQLFKFDDDGVTKINFGRKYTFTYYQDDCSNNLVELAYINPMGGLEAFYFTSNFDAEYQVEFETYPEVDFRMRNPDNFNIRNRNKKYIIQSDDIITLKSQNLTPQDWWVLTGLLESEKVWIISGDKKIPVIIRDSNLRYEESEDNSIELNITIDR